MLLKVPAHSPRPLRAQPRLRDGRDSPASGLTGFVRIVHLLEEIVDYGHSVFDLIATEAVDRCFGAVIDQLQPKQRCAITIARRIRQHPDLIAADRSDRNRCLRTSLGKRAESDVAW